VNPAIGIDLDGCIIDNDVVWVRYMNKGACGRRHPVPHPTSQRWDYLQDICEVCFDFCLKDSDIVLSHNPRLDAMVFLDRAQSELDLHLITSRPREANEATLVWLDKWDMLKFFKSVTITSDKRKECAQRGLAMLVDDAPHNMLSVKGTATVPLIFDRPWNRDCPIRNRVYGWDWFTIYTLALESASHTDSLTAPAAASS
jgi:uncharacterized HAD superfamily protein